MATHQYHWHQALAQCGGNVNLCECAQYPNEEWLKAHATGESMSYWPWVSKCAQRDGKPLEALAESEASYTRRTRQLPGANTLH